MNRVAIVPTSQPLDRIRHAPNKARAAREVENEKYDNVPIDRAQAGPTKASSTHSAARVTPRQTHVTLRCLGNEAKANRIAVEANANEYGDADASA